MYKFWLHSSNKPFILCVLILNYFRCEHTLANAAGEGQALTEAARAFLEAEMANRDLKCPSFEEHLSASINCYSHAIRVSGQKKGKKENNMRVIQ